MNLSNIHLELKEMMVTFLNSEQFSAAPIFRFHKIINIDYIYLYVKWYS